MSRDKHVVKFQRAWSSLEWVGWLVFLIPQHTCEENGAWFVFLVKFTISTDLLILNTCLPFIGSLGSFVSKTRFESILLSKENASHCGPAWAGHGDCNNAGRGYPRLSYRDQVFHCCHHVTRGIHAGYRCMCFVQYSTEI